MAAVPAFLGSGRTLKGVFTFVFGFSSSGIQSIGTCTGISGLSTLRLFTYGSVTCFIDFNGFPVTQFEGLI